MEGLEVRHPILTTLGIDILPAPAALDPAHVTHERVLGPKLLAHRLLHARRGQGDEGYLKQAVGAYETTLGKLIRKGELAGGTLDASTPDREAAVAALDACLMLYEGTGEPQYLSDARAATVKKELSAQGIAGERIETAGMGEADPVADNATEEGRAKNRRTELVIVRK